MRMLTFILTSLAVFVPVKAIWAGDTPAGQNARLEAFLATLERQHGPTKTLAVRFHQHKYFSFMDGPIVSEGFILFAAPDKIRFEICSPFRSLLMDDGKRVKRYEFQNENGGNSKTVLAAASKSL